MENEQPNIEIINYVENEDGSATIEFQTNKAFDRMYLAETGKKRVTKKGLSNYILELLEKAVNKLDGYDLEHMDKSSPT